MVPYIYGEFTEAQMEEYKKKLHKKMFWLLLFEDPKTKDQYINQDIDQYFYNLLLEIDGLNRLLDYPAELVEMQSVLCKAKCLRLHNIPNYPVYRKLILDAHSLLDKSFEEVMQK